MLVPVRHVVGAGAYNPRFWRSDAGMRTNEPLRAPDTDALWPSQGSESTLLGKRNRQDHYQNLWCVLHVCASAGAQQVHMTRLTGATL